MNNTFTFHPPQQVGVVFHVVCIAVLMLAGIVGLYRIAYADVGPAFLLYLSPILLAIPLVPLLIYRLSYLQNAVYILERDSVRLQWGLRVEVIPNNTILWIKKRSDLVDKIRSPWIRWPGSVLGSRQLNKDTAVEFMASTSKDLILLATYERVFAISPSDPDAFLSAYQRLTELGSLISPQPQSVHPNLLLAGVWQNLLSRTLILLGLVFSLALVTWVFLVGPTITQVSLGFLPGGEPRNPIPGMRLMLLPILNTIFWVFNFFAGLLLFRREEQRPLSYLLWGNCVFVSGLFLVATYFILRIG